MKAAQGRTEDALSNFRNAAAVLELLCRRYPADTLARRRLMFAYGDVGDLLGPAQRNFGYSEGAVKAYQQMADHAKVLYDADPADARAVGDYGSALLKLGLATPKAAPERQETLARSLTLLERASSSNPQNITIANNLTRSESELGRYQAAIEESEKTLRGAPGDWSALEVMEFAVGPLAKEQARKGRRQEALATLEHSLGWAAAMNTAAPPTSKNVPSTAIAWQTAGSVYAMLSSAETGQTAAADGAASREWYSRAINEWQKIEHDNSFLPAFAADLKADKLALAGLERNQRSHP